MVVVVDGATHRVGIHNNRMRLRAPEPNRPTMFDVSLVDTTVLGGTPILEWYFTINGGLSQMFHGELCDSKVWAVEVPPSSLCIFTIIADSKLDPRTATTRLVIQVDTRRESCCLCGATHEGRPRCNCFGLRGGWSTAEEIRCNN